VSVGTRTCEVVAAEHGRGPSVQHAYEHTYRVHRVAIASDCEERRAGVTSERRQLRLDLAYVCTFNEVQGKTLDRAIVDVASPVFAHAQVYVLLGRVNTCKCWSERLSAVHTLLCVTQKGRALCIRASTLNSHVCTYISVTDVGERLLLSDTFPVGKQRASFEVEYPVPPAAAPLFDPPSKAPPPPPSHA